MDILFLGTGSGVPAKHRNTSSLVLKMLNERNEMWMFDCGEATQHQILKTTLKPRKITKIFITHMHGDHIYGLPGFLSSRVFQSEVSDEMTIYGPKGIKEFVQTTLKLSQTHIRYPIHFVEISDEKGVLFESDDVIVSYGLLKHGIPCYGYRVEEKPKAGTLDVAKLKADGIQEGPLFGRIKNGETIKLEDGRIINGKDYIGEDIPGRIVAIIGDTKPTDIILDLVKDADVMVHESTFEHSEKKMAHNYNHSTNVQAAQYAKAGGVKQLYLNHVSARYLGRDVKMLENEARKVFSNTRVVSDLHEFSI